MPMSHCLTRFLCAAFTNVNIFIVGSWSVNIGECIRDRYRTRYIMVRICFDLTSYECKNELYMVDKFCSQF